MFRLSIGSFEGQGVVLEQIWWIRFPTAINVWNSFPVCFSNGHFVLQGFARARSSDFFSLKKGVPVWERIPFKGVGLLDQTEKLALRILGKHFRLLQYVAWEVGHSIVQYFADIVQHYSAIIGFVFDGA